MLHSLKRIASSTRLKRRQLAMILAMVTTPALADNTGSGAIRMMPPLPLEEIERASTLHSNHRGRPVQPTAASTVRLAGAQQPPNDVQLKPVSNATGLRNAEPSPSDAEARSAIKIEKLQPRGVRLNPLAYDNGESPAEPQDDQGELQPKSNLAHTTTPPVQQNNFAIAPPAPEPIEPREPSETSRPSVDEEPIFYSLSDLSDGVSPPAKPTTEKSLEPRQPKAEKQGRAAETPTVEPAESALPATVSRFQLSGRKPLAVPPLGVQEVEPPTFDRQAGRGAASMAKRSPLPSVANRTVKRQDSSPSLVKQEPESEAASQVFAPTVIEPAPHSTIRSGGASVLQAAEPIDFSEEPLESKQPSDSKERNSLSPAEPPAEETTSLSLDRKATRKAVAVPVKRAAAGVSLVKPFELSEPDEASADSESVEIDTPSQARSQPTAFEGGGGNARPLSRDRGIQQSNAKTLQRYRPPVEVKQVPIVVGRRESQLGNGPTVQPVQALSIDSQRTIEVLDGQQLVPLRMTKAEARTLKVGGEIVDVQLGDAGICHVMKASSNELKLVGTDHGVTRLLVRARTDDHAELQTRVFEIRIGAAVGDTIHQTQQHARLLNHSISEAFPKCRVVVRAYPDKLTVNGVCDGEASAKQIMRMVRKTCLVPVEDLLTIR